MPRHSKVTKLLSDLVSIPSVNPSLLVEKSSLGGEEEVAVYLSEYSKGLGISIQRQAVLPGRRNIVFRIKPKGKIKHRVMLALIWMWFPLRRVHSDLK